MPSNLTMIREFIKDQMKQQGYSHRKMAVAVGCRQATITDFLNGKHDISSGFFEKIMDVLKLKIQ